MVGKKGRREDGKKRERERRKRERRKREEERVGRTCGSRSKCGNALPAEVLFWLMWIVK